jgi:arsenite methyltransferase
LRQSRLLRRPSQTVVGYIARAILIDDYRLLLGKAGFSHVEVIDSGSESERLRQGREPGGLSPAVTGRCGSAERLDLRVPSAPFHARMTELLRRYNVNEYAANVRVFALKP